MSVWFFGSSHSVIFVLILVTTRHKHHISELDFEGKLTSQSWDSWVQPSLNTVSSMRVTDSNTNWSVLASTTRAAHSFSIKICIIIDTTRLLVGFTSLIPVAAISSIVFGTEVLFHTFQSKSDKVTLTTPTSTAHFFCFKVYSVIISAGEIVCSLSIPITTIVSIICEIHICIKTLWLKVSVGIKLFWL